MKIKIYLVGHGRDEHKLVSVHLSLREATRRWKELLKDRDTKYEAHVCVWNLDLSNGHLEFVKLEKRNNR